MLTEERFTTRIVTMTRRVKQPAEVLKSSGPFAAGGIYSDVEDLHRFLQMLNQGELLEGRLRESAYKGCQQNPRYGFGWEVDTEHFAKKLVGHTGGAPGFRSVVAMVPEDGFQVILLDNHENADLRYLSVSIFKILYDQSVSLPSETPLTMAELQRYVGVYELSGEPQFILRTAIFDNRLTLEILGQPRTTLVAQPGHRFLHIEGEAVIEFVPTGNGTFDSVIATTPGRTMSGKRSRGTWGILGDATDRGWDSTSDLPLAESPKQPGVWQAKRVGMKRGEFKFRFNNDWGLNFGDDLGDRQLDRNGKNMQCEEGTYDILLDLSDEEFPKLEMKQVK
jgi:hypothetical protein